MNDNEMALFMVDSLLEANAGIKTKGGVNKPIAKTIFDGWIDCLSNLGWTEKLSARRLPMSIEGDLAMQVAPKDGLNLGEIGLAGTLTVPGFNRAVIILSLSPDTTRESLVGKDKQIMMLAEHEADHVRRWRKSGVRSSGEVGNRSKYLSSPMERPPLIGGIIDQMDWSGKDTMEDALKASPLWQEYESTVFTTPSGKKHRSKMLSKIAHWWNNERKL